MRSSTYVFLLGVLIPFFSYGNEILYFSCKTKKGDVKLFSDESKLHYEFSKNNVIELSYQSLDDTFSGFSHNYYYRYQAEYGKVSFNKGKYKYSIYSSYEDNESQSGIIVDISGKEYNLPCVKVIENNLVNLFPLLSCDTDDALGCYPNK